VNRNFKTKSKNAKRSTEIIFTIKMGGSSENVKPDIFIGAKECDSPLKGQSRRFSPSSPSNMSYSAATE